MSSTRRKPTTAKGLLRRDPLASLKMADLMILKPALPAEVLATIVDYLTVPDLLRFARVSRRMHEMVYEDSRWVRRLKRMGCWNDTDARNHPDQPSAPKLAANGALRRPSTIDRTIVNGKGRPETSYGDTHSNGVPAVHPARHKASVHQPNRLHNELADGFDFVVVSNPEGTGSDSTPTLEAALTVLDSVKSTRGQARIEYGKVYKPLSRFYNDALSCSSPMNALIFKLYHAPEQQAQMLSQIRIFSLSDFSPGSTSRDRKLREIVNVFDTAALLEFRKGYEYKDIQGLMRQYAYVMHKLNGGQSSVELFLHDNRLIAEKATLGSASDCVDYSMGYSSLSLERVQAYFDRLGTAYSQELAIIQTAFPSPNIVAMLFLERVCDEVLGPFVASLISEATSRGMSMFLKVVPGSFAGTQQFVKDFALPNNSDETMTQKANEIVAKIFEPHLETYLAEELTAFQQRADSEIDRWDKALSEQDASREEFLMSNVNRQADKKDFMSSFRKVVMMPVNLLPNLSVSSTHKPVTKTPAEALSSSHIASRPSTPDANSLQRISIPMTIEAPANELAAKAALMETKLENIKSLFSLEVALNIVHAAKSSLERAAQFIALGGESGTAAREQCTSIFVSLLQTVGVRHVKAGFDKAIDHLAGYDPRSTSTNTPAFASGKVAPLATFLELVNVGDLIQQMLDVFYESELVRLRISNRDDFLDRNVKEKKKFEAMLDERVAAGLGKGIDVLMDEVEYICATTQLPTDFNPDASSTLADIGPTTTARRVVDLVSSHTSMLFGSTDKSLLDVFTGEVGLRLFQTLQKHIKRQRISTTGSLPLLSDLSAYAKYIAGFKNPDLNSYFAALREVGQIYLIDGKSDRDIKEMATIISDQDRYAGVFTVDEVVEFAERRVDWLLIRSRVEAKVQGDSCTVM